MKHMFISTLLFTIIAFTSCATPAITKGSMSLTDKTGNTYLASYDDDYKTKTCKVVIKIKGKIYSCEVDYTAAAPDAMGFSIDTSTVDITGTVSITYKTIKVDCGIEGDTLTPEDKSDIEKAVKDSMG